VAAWVFMVASCHARSFEAVVMDSPVAGQQAEVQQYIGFDSLIAAIDPNAGVAVAWPDLRQFFQEGERDWELYRDQIQFTDAAGLVERLLLFRKGDAQLTIDLFVSSLGPRPALNRLVNVMAATSIGYRRYERGPADIGQLCLVLAVPNPTVLVLDRNVFVRIRRDNHSMDIVPIAQRLAKFMDLNVVPTLAAKAPVFASVSANSTTPGVGEAVKISVTLPSGFQPETLMWALSHDVDPDVVDKRDQTVSYVELRISRPGHIEVPLSVADRRTLLSSESRVSLDVRK
jgi:hypothetical protein